jgi:hypothetical protein
MSHTPEKAFRDALKRLQAAIHQRPVDDRTGWRQCEAHHSLYLCCDDSRCRYIWQLEDTALDLLEALQKLSKEVSGLIGNYEPMLSELIGNTNAAVLHDRLIAARATIAKAEPKS